MAGISIVFDLSRKNPNFYSIAFSAQAAASAAAISIAAGNPFASRFLFGTGILPVAYCDAGATLDDDDYMSTIRIASRNVFRNDVTEEYSPKDYSIELRPLYSAFKWKAFLLTSLRSFLTFYLPLLEPRASLEDEDDDFLPDTVQEDHRVDLLVPFKKSVKQIIRETTVVTTRRILERVAVHNLSQRMAWKLLKDVPKSAVRKAQRGMPSYVFFFNVSKTTFRGHFLGVAASWVVQVGIEVYRFMSWVCKAKEVDEMVKVEKAKLLRKKICCAAMRCGASLVFGSIGAGMGATLFRPSTGQWIGCTIGDFAGPIIVTFCFEKVHFQL